MEALLLRNKLEVSLSAVPEIGALEPELESLYRDLHQHPELAFHEQQTAAAISIHDEPSLPSGKVGFHSGLFRASVDSVDVTIFGRGGHGARPQLTVDPIVLAARAILGMQTIVSRESDPQSPAVVRIGSIHGGTSANIIPDEVRMLMSLRSYDEKVRKHLLTSIKRQLDAEAMAADAPSLRRLRSFQVREPSSTILSSLRVWSMRYAGIWAAKA